MLDGEMVAATDAVAVSALVVVTVIDGDRDEVAVRDDEGVTDAARDALDVTLEDALRDGDTLRLTLIDALMDGETDMQDVKLPSPQMYVGASGRLLTAK